MTTTTATQTHLTDTDLTEEIAYQQRMIATCSPAGIAWRTERLARAQAEQNRRIANSH